MVKDGGSFFQLKVSDLLCIYSENSITFGITSTKRYIINETIDQLLNTLDTSEFYQINRGQIVSKSAVDKISPYFNSRVKLQIKGYKAQDFIVSRNKTSNFKDWMNR